MRLLDSVAIGLSFLMPAFAGCADPDADSPAAQQAAADAPAADSKWPRIPTERLPSWLKLGVELRGRLDTELGLKYNPGPDDTYYLHRLRLDITIEPRPWLRFFVMGQDARVAGYDRPRPANVADSMNLHQAYVQFGRVEERSWGLRAGRQELRFGEARLVGSSNWSNVARSYDAVRLSYKGTGVELDWFAASIVKTADGQFDRPRLRDGFYGFYSSFKHLIPDSVIEPYLLWKLNSQVHSEAGLPGHEDVYTPGIRAAGQLPARFDYSVEIAAENGHYAQDHIRAWAGHWLLGWRLPAAAWSPRLLLASNHASGDGNHGDGRHGTFDPLYPTNHAQFGSADRITWRNMNSVSGGLQLRPASKWLAELEYHDFWLATRQDGMYTDSGVLWILNRKATSSSIGREIDLRVSYHCSGPLELGFGYAHLFAGPYLRQSTKERGSTYPYVMWSYKL